MGSINVRAKPSLSNSLRSHARVRPIRQHEDLHAYNELHLLSEQQRARAKVETEEALFRNLQIRATLWLPPLPERQTGRNSIFSTLAEEWTQPVPNAAQRGTNYDAGLTRQIEQLARGLQEQEQRGRQADALIADLHRRHESDERRHQEDQNFIESLESRLQEQEQERRGRQVDALIADLHRRHESDERRHQEDRNVIESLESRLQEQEQQSRMDRVLIAQLQESCRQWSPVLSTVSYC